MTPKMTVKVTPKMTPKRQRMTLKAKEMTPKKQRMTPRMIPKIKELNSLLLKQTSEMIVWYSINDSYGKEK